MKAGLREIELLADEVLKALFVCRVNGIAPPQECVVAVTAIRNTARANAQTDK